MTSPEFGCSHCQSSGLSRWAAVKCDIKLISHLMMNPGSGCVINQLSSVFLCGRRYHSVPHEALLRKLGHFIKSLTVLLTERHTTKWAIQICNNPTSSQVKLKFPHCALISHSGSYLLFVTVFFSAIKLFLSIFLSFSCCL